MFATAAGANAKGAVNRLGGAATEPTFTTEREEVIPITAAAAPRGPRTDITGPNSECFFVFQ
jgi:hypothetical protein